MMNIFSSTRCSLLRTDVNILDTVYFKVNVELFRINCLSNLMFLAVAWFPSTTLVHMVTMKLRNCWCGTEPVSMWQISGNLRHCMKLLLRENMTL